jgi:hypothetical protein
MQAFSQSDLVRLLVRSAEAWLRAPAWLHCDSFVSGRCEAAATGWSAKTERRNCAYAIQCATLISISAYRARHDVYLAASYRSLVPRRRATGGSTRRLGAAHSQAWLYRLEFLQIQAPHRSSPIRRTHSLCLSSRTKPDVALLLTCATTPRFPAGHSFVTGS